jgi:hypothetical protein
LGIFKLYRGVAFPGHLSEIEDQIAAEKSKNKPFGIAA